MENESYLLDLPIDRSVNLHNASYKNPARIVVRSKEPAFDWEVYFWLDGETAWLGRLAADKDTTALVYKVAMGAKDRGINSDLHVHSGGALSEVQIHEAETVYFFAVAPDKSARSLVWPCSNDKYIPLHGDTGPPWELGVRGTPAKARPAKFAKKGIDYPPGYAPGDDNGEPDAMSLLNDVRTERAKYGRPLPIPQMGALLNAVAWNNRHDGWGLAGKDHGKHTIQPRSGFPISRDLLYHQPTNRLFDVLRDVEDTAEPVWNEVENDGRLPWVAPVVPLGAVEPDDPVPPSDDLYDRVAKLEADFRKIARTWGELA